MHKTLSRLAMVSMLGASTFAAVQTQAAEEERLFSLNDPMAAFLETRAYAERMGATAEFRKMEGVALDEKNGKIYIAMSAIEKTMSDDKGDIQLPKNKCGIVYEGKLDSNYNISELKPAVIGGPYNKEVTSEYGSGFADKCDPDNIANPDGLYADKHGNLWISEDTSSHVNNAIWRWDGKELKRFATVPTGAEITGVHVTANDELFFNVQHPSAMSKFPYNRGVVGTVNGFKSNDSFTSVDVPKGDDVFDVKIAKGAYQVLARVGEPIPNDIYNQRFGQINTMAGDLKEICNHPDGNMFLPIAEDGSYGYLYTNYECRPGTVGKIYIEKDGDSWKILDGENVSFAAVGGTWNNCNASVTPWNTGLSSEEYEPMASKTGWKKNVVDMSIYLGEQANPYNYGYLVELLPDTNGDFAGTHVVKHYAMGRLSYEMGRVMPDMKTVYSGDDGTGVILAKFVADTPKELSAGTIYAAKIKQNSDESLAITWIELGRSTDADVYDAIQSVSMK
ncbi:alkaline phosphatase PhoX [Desulfogranum japonicum]|uniref:alkaline phosphatase PhoX n=1 Tax=Desulfogranum japonicum TaxID=231447 RepID=UPI00041DD9C2|nr:alkaline phosphatase PhoX [Desulfogranum japonicum]